MMRTLDYPTLERQVMELQERALRNTEQQAFNAALPSGMQMQVQAQRDMARGGVNLHIRGVNMRDYSTAVIENITWRAIRPGEEAPTTALFLDEHGAMQLVDQLGDFNGQARRADQYRTQRDNAQNEMRSLMNQLEEVRNHNRSLMDSMEETQRHVRWLERELRDANRERRESARAV